MSRRPGRLGRVPLAGLVMASWARCSGVGAADVDGDGIADIITGAGPGGGPHVRAFSFGTGTPVEIASVFAYDPDFGGGVVGVSGRRR